ncbi:MAG: hypothetical protein GY943_20630 [Chloroflexi bacterium]|nr:hypothetical protein [Chloroflexota bacterium]
MSNWFMCSLSNEQTLHSLFLLLLSENHDELLYAQDCWKPVTAVSTQTYVRERPFFSPN